MRNNQKSYKKQPYLFRKKIEVLFSQLCDQFIIRSNYARLLIVLEQGYYLK